MSTKPSQTQHALQGYRIALLIAQDNPLSPAQEFQKQGATLLHYPVAQELPPDSYDALDSALARCQSGDATWLLLTAPRVVEAVATRMREIGLATKEAPQVSLAVFGAKTQLAVGKLLPGWNVTVADSTSHEQLVAAMQLTPEDKVVIPIAQRSRADWAELVAATGAEANAVPAYRLLLGRGGDDLPGLLWEGNVDVMVFLTENSVRHFSVRLKAEGGTLDMLEDVVVVCFDGATAIAARAFGLDVQLIIPADEAGTAADFLANKLRVKVTQR